MSPSPRPRPSRSAPRARRALAWVFAFLLAAPLAAACSTQADQLASSVSLPDGIPAPSHASVVVGQGGGYDAGAALFAFSSDLAPAAALKGYEKELAASGFTAAGTDASWVLFRRGRIVVGIRVGESGPPTDLLVTVSGNSRTGVSGGGNGSSQAGAGRSGPGGSPGWAGTRGQGNGAGSSGGAGAGATADPGGNVPNGGRDTDPGANAGNPGANAGNPGATPNRDGHVPAAGATPSPPSGAASDSSTDSSGSAGATPNPGTNIPGAGAGKTGATPVPQPDPPHGRAPSAPPGQTKPTPATGSTAGASAAPDRSTTGTV